MTAATTPDPARLGELRAKIDAIDESIHRLLMQRALVIDELILVKGTARNGAAFRPGREADMMRRLVDRHQGHLPLSAVEHLWREIISTFTALQAPFDVAVSLAGDPVAAVETARFYFGFSVPLLHCAGPAAVLEALEAGGDRLGVVGLDGSEAWWEGLRSAQVMARLPFLAIDGRQAARPAIVLAPPLSDPVPFEVECFAVRAAGLEAASRSDVEVLAAVPLEGSIALLVASFGGRAAVEKAVLRPLDIRPVGGYAAPLRIGA